MIAMGSNVYDLDLAALLEESPAALFIVDRQGKWRYANRACREIFLNGGAPAVDSVWQEYVDPADRMGVLSKWQASVDARTMFDAEFRPALERGPVRWLRVLARPLPGSRDTAFSAMIEDVTARHEYVEDAGTRDLVCEILQKSAELGHSIPQVLERLGAALECRVGMFWTVDNGAGALRFSSAWRDPAAPDLSALVDASQLLTFAPGRGLPGRVWATRRVEWISDVSSSDNFPRAALASAAGLRFALAFPVLSQEEFRGVMEFLSAETRNITPETDRLLGALGQHVGAFMERIQTEEALRNSEELFRKTAEEVGEVFWCRDVVRNRMLYVSAAYEKIWGNTCESLYRQPDSFLDSVHPDDRTRVRAFLERQKSSERTEEEYRILQPDGSIRWIRDRAFLLRNNHGEIDRIAGIASDTTPRKRLEEQFRQSQKQEALGFLVGGLAHDFNNLLTGIMGNASLAIAELPPRTPARDELSNIVQASERAAALISQMLAYAGKSHFQRRRNIDISHLVSSAIRSMVPGAGIKIAFSPGAGLPFVVGDPSLLRQLVGNLLENAFEAIGDARGQVNVTTGVRAIDERTWDAFIPDRLAAGKYVTITIADTGSGMDETTLARIFDPFFTTKFMGRGLGLAAALGIARSHHGAITVKTAPGRGSVFTVFLPESAASQVSC